MSVRRHLQPLFVMLLCLSVFAARTGGMHLHLCLDGQEAPAEVHWADTGIHNDVEHATESHDDRDVDLGDGIAKTFKGSGDFSLAILAAAILLTLVLLPRQTPPQPQRIWVSRPTRLLRPPLRGPPLVASLTP